MTKLEAVLYEHDPYGFGSSSGAPRDEYADEAARIAAFLSRVAQGALDHELVTLFPDSASLREALLRATVDFRQTSN
jgi:hypothetical protein